MRAYPEEYLNEIVKTQGCLFDFAAHDFLTMNTTEFINTYMVSKTRKSIDVAQSDIITMNARDLWEHFISNEGYDIKLDSIPYARVEKRCPFFIGKTLNVAMPSPYDLVVEFETGEKRILNIKKYIENDPEMYPLLERIGVLCKPQVSLCGYQTAWKLNGCYIGVFHNDYVYLYGRDITGALGGSFPKWLGEFYAYYQWYYNIPSAVVIRKLPVELMHEKYLYMHYYPPEQAVQKIGCI